MNATAAETAPNTYAVKGDGILDFLLGAGFTVEEAAYLTKGTEYYGTPFALDGCIEVLHACDEENGTRYVVTFL